MKLALQQEYSYVLSQAAHHAALIRSKPMRIGNWRKLLACKVKVWWKKIKWMRSDEYKAYLRKIASRK